MNFHSVLVGLHQRIGNGGQRQLLNSHQQFVLCTFDLRDQGLFEVIAIAPFPCERMAVAAAVAMVEVQRNAIGYRQWIAPSSHHLPWLAAAQQQQRKC